MHQEHLNGAALLAIQQQTCTFLGHHGDPHQKQVSHLVRLKRNARSSGKGYLLHSDLPNIRTGSGCRSLCGRTVTDEQESNIVCLAGTARKMLD